MLKQTVFSTASFPTIEYISFLLQVTDPWMELHEHFVKQTNRNRYHISGPNGIQSLHIPINHNKLNFTNINEVKIFDDSTWQRTHWRTITACYNRSAYFEFYADDLNKLFFSRYAFLFDFNQHMLAWILKSLKKEMRLNYTSAYNQHDDHMQDFRALSDCNDTKALTARDFKKYPQVFEQKHGFTKNLSVIDLLFNMGPAATDYL